MAFAALSMLLSCAKDEPVTEIQGIPYADAQTGTFYEWPAYNPTIHYDFKESEDYAKWGMPTKNLPWTRASQIYDNGKYWSYYEGPNANSAVKGLSLIHI